MEPFTVAVLVGSLRQDSINRRLARALAAMAPERLRFELLELGDLPLFNQDHETAPGAAVERFRAAMDAADALLFVTPEYNRSIPGVLKNAIDHASRPPGQRVFAGKPAAVMGVSPGATGTALAQQHLRNILAHLDTVTMGQPELFLQAREGFFDADGGIGEGSRAFLQRWLERFAAWVERHARR